MKFTSHTGVKAEVIVTRLITVVLSTYALALFAQTVGVAHLV